MCERSSDSSIPPQLLGRLDQPCGYRVTEEGLKALAEYEERHGKAVLEAVPLPSEVVEAFDDKARREGRRQRRKEARKRGLRVLTVCGRWRSDRRIPDLRLTGLWLRDAGFDLGQEFEVEVQAGALTLRAV